MTRKNILRLVVGAALAAFFAWLVLRQIDAGQIGAAFSGTDRTWIAAALVMFCAGYAARIQRWLMMLRIDNPGLRWRQCAGPLLGSFAANNMLPFRAGDVLRAFAFNKQLGTDAGTVMAALFVERLLDLLMVLVLLGTTLALSGMDSSRFAGFGSLVLIAGAGAILLVLLLPRTVAPVLLGAGRAVARLAPGSGGKLLAGIEKGLLTLQHLARGTTMLQLSAWSAAAWMAEGCVFWFAALAMP